MNRTTVSSANQTSWQLAIDQPVAYFCYSPRSEAVASDELDFATGSVPTKTEAYALGITYSALIIASLLTNLIFITTLLRLKVLSTPSLIIFLISINDSITAILFSALWIPNIILQRLWYGCLGCSMSSLILTHLLQSISLTTLAVVDRYIAVVHSFKYSGIVSNRRILYVAGTVYIINWVVSFIPMMNYGRYAFITINMVCVPDFSYPKPYSFDIFHGCVAYTEILICTACYIRILVELKRMHRIRPIHSDSSEFAKATKSILIIVLVFYLTWIPSATASRFRKYDMYKWYLHLAAVLVLTNGFTNSLIYGLGNRDVRSSFRAICTHLCKGCLGRSKLTISDAYR